MPKIIFMPHANIQYSQLAPEKRLWVIENCYEKLFDLIDGGDYKIAFEASGITIEEIANKCPRCLEKLKKLVAEGKKVTVVLGFNSKDDVFCEDEFKALGADVHISTADGTYGTKGFVTDVIKNMQYTFFYTCGPEPMFRAMHKMMKTPGQYSFEERMGCGFGACMGCSCKTLTGNKRICKEGPVMESEEIIWAD